MSSIRQSQFVEKHKSEWQAFESFLDYKELSRSQKNNKKEPIEKPDDIDLPDMYRKICHHFALANSRMYNPVLVEKLNKLVVRGHHALYSTRSNFWHSIIEYFTVTFPTLVRKEWKVVGLSAALFYVPFIAIIVLIQFNPDMVYSVMDSHSVSSLESMYEPERNSRMGRERESDSDVYMFGFYIKHNIGIDFKMFAGGMLYGIGSLFFLIFNGIYLGTAFGHMTHLGYFDSFWGFVAGHGSFELTAMVLSGAAGLKLAQALIIPGRKSRNRALIDNGKKAINIMYGVIIMSVIAAFIEAFWSSAVMPVMIKYVVGIILWVLVLAYFIFVGRNRTRPS